MTVITKCYVGSRVGKKGDGNKRCLLVSNLYDTKYISCVWWKAAAHGTEQEQEFNTKMLSSGDH